MRQAIILAGLAALIFLTNGCKKDSLSGRLEGTWEIRQAAGMLVVDYPAGNGTMIKFQGNNYEMIDNGQVTQSGTYSIVPDPSVSTETCLVIPAGKYENRIIFNNSPGSNKVFFEIIGNKLYLISGCFALDGGVTRKYVKQ